MIYQKLELHIAQVERAKSHFRSSFPIQKKNEIYNDLGKLFEAIKKSAYRSFNEGDLSNTRFALDLIFYSLQHLDYNTEKEVPKRLIFCLEKVLNDWISNATDNYFIVISHNNSTDQFLIRAIDEGNLDVIDKYFLKMFGVGYKQSLIQISKPRSLFDDYLGSIPVYHELGHFIEKNYQIVTALFRDPSFMPGILGIDREMHNLHYQEYFADLFAAQYVGRSSVEPLNYIAYAALNSDSHTHPSNKKRIDVVNTFLLGSGDPWAVEVIDNLKKSTLARTTRELKIRNIALSPDENPFETLTSFRMDQPGKVHCLFSLGWENWLNPTSKIQKKYPEPVQCIDAINRLIKQSIELTRKSEMPKKWWNIF